MSQSSKMTALWKAVGETNRLLDIPLPYTQLSFKLLGSIMGLIREKTEITGKG